MAWTVYETAMKTHLKYVATACMSCRRTALIVQDAVPPLACPRCRGASRLVPGAEYLADELALFNALEHIVEQAQLQVTTAALLAAELETVSERWEPPELVLARATRRLPGLNGCYSPRQDYAQLVLVVNMLLTMVCARLHLPRPEEQRWTRESGIRPRYRVGLDEEPLHAVSKLASK